MSRASTERFLFPVHTRSSRTLTSATARINAQRARERLKGRRLLWTSPPPLAHALGSAVETSSVQIEYEPGPGESFAYAPALKRVSVPKPHEEADLPRVVACRPIDGAEL